MQACESPLLYMYSTAILQQGANMPCHAFIICLRDRRRVDFEGGFATCLSVERDDHEPPVPSRRQAIAAAPLPRRQSVGVDVGGVMVGGGAPIVVQSMTNTDTADVEATAQQVAALARAGSELVRITVDRDEAAAAVPHIRDRLAQMRVTVPLIGDFHYIGHKLLADHPACAEALDKYRINPGNVGFSEKQDRQFGAIIEMAIRYGKPVRIGVNWGSLDQALLTSLMDENADARRAAVRPAR